MNFKKILEKKVFNFFVKKFNFIVWTKSLFIFTLLLCVML